MINESALEIGDLERDQLPKAPPIVRPLCRRSPARPDDWAGRFYAGDAMAYLRRQNTVGAAYRRAREPTV
jgi:hypothetical protein